jgi:glycosyltransferase involved in cell wall biosynthesis
MKDHATFLNAAAQTVKQTDRFRFVCVGGGPEAELSSIKRESADAGLADWVQWTGRREDMAAVYSALDILTSSSISEGFSNVIGEAMAAGTPCVVTDVGDSACVVGDTGVVVAPGDPNAMRSAWLDLAQCDLADLGRRARRRVEEEFSVGNLVRRTESTLLELLGGGTIAGSGRNGEAGG